MAVAAFLRFIVGGFRCRIVVFRVRAFDSFLRRAAAAAATFSPLTERLYFYSVGARSLNQREREGEREIGQFF